MPIGLNGVDIIIEVHASDLAGVRPPEPFTRFLADGGYLLRRVPLLKHVAALPDNRSVAWRIAGVDPVGLDDAAVRLHERLRRLIAHALAPSADRDFRAKAEQALGHSPAEPGAAAGDENLFEKV